MRIGLDYVPAMAQQAGIARFTRDLTLAAVDQPSQHEFVLLGPFGSSPPGWVNEHPRVRWATLPAPARAMGAIWYRFRIPAPVEWFTGPIDLFHATDYLAPPSRRAKTVVTIHDLSFLRHPEFADPDLARYLTIQVPLSVRRASLVLADSEFTRQELITLLNLSREQVAVVYGGVGPDFHPVQDEGQDDLPEPPYILFVGRIEPRKNIGTLLRAYRLLLEQQKDSPPLVIAGGKGWLYEPIFRLADELRLGSRVRFMGHVPDNRLPALLSRAEVFVYPSHYEGFGLPPLEAMACGTPVVASNASSLPEVLGDAALLVAPGDTGALAEAISTIQRDSSLAADLRARGIDRAARFSWAAAAKQLFEAYALTA
jgi:glycosyltransferase involved in cell wall biosynthesis